MARVRNAVKYKKGDLLLLQNLPRTIISPSARGLNEGLLREVSRRYENPNQPNMKYSDWNGEIVEILEEPSLHSEAFHIKFLDKEDWEVNNFSRSSHYHRRISQTIKGVKDLLDHWE